MSWAVAPETDRWLMEPEALELLSRYDLSDIQEVDLNPIIAYERGLTIVDAKIRVGL